MGIGGEQPAGRDRLASEPDVAVGSPDGAQLSRRTVLRAAAITGAGVPLLAACGSGSSAATTPTATVPAGGGGRSQRGGPSQSTGNTTASSTGLATTSQVPEGGGLILANAGVVITQPSAGTFKGFSSTCTHAGCPVDNVTNGTINCICHGSQFSIKDGSVVTGPATVPLPPKPITVKGKEISLK